MPAFYDRFGPAHTFPVRCISKKGRPFVLLKRIQGVIKEIGWTPAARLGPGPLLASVTIGSRVSAGQGDISKFEALSASAAKRRLTDETMAVTTRI